MPTHSQGNNVTFGIAMPAELADEVKCRAAQLGISVSLYFRQLTIRELEENAGQPMGLLTMLDAAPKMKVVKKRKRKGAK